MCEGRGKLEWGQTAAVLSMIHNVNCPKEADLLPPDHYNPYAKKESGPKESEVLMLPITVLKDVFVRT